MLDYAKRANTETRLSVLIEHPRAIENIDEILAVEGLGGAIAAPLDLAVNMASPMVRGTLKFRKPSRMRRRRSQRRGSSDFRLLGDFKSVFDLDAQIPYGRFQL
jgi:2-keto-3-deoxy-L-rhamnonate aldolase RhmA